jgi:hypothetical protein
MMTNLLKQYQFLLKITLSLGLITLITSCGNSPEVMAEGRVFLPLSLEFLGEYQLKENTFENTRLGGLSGITYDRANDLFYAVSDDRSNHNPARFYTLKLNLTAEEAIANVTVENVTFLKDENGVQYLRDTVDFEGIALSVRNTLFLSSEGVYKNKIDPLIKEFDLTTGQVLNHVKIPQRFLLDENEQTGIQDNLGFESLSLGISSLAADDPFRLFTATEYNLLQDYSKENPEPQSSIRFLHYLINPIGEPLLVAEHLYLLEPNPEGGIYHGLSELTSLDREGYLLSLERTFGLSGYGAKIFQLVMGNATDTSGVESLRGNPTTIQPIQKQLLLDLNNLGITLDNLEGMAIGPRLKDGSLSLLLVSDDNFRNDQVTQFLLFRIKNN